MSDPRYVCKREYTLGGAPFSRLFGDWKNAFKTGI